MRVPWARCRSSLFRTVSNVTALNVAHRERMNVPVRKLTAPKHATDLAGGRREQDRLLDLGRHPHAAPGAMLLEMAFVHAPEFNASAPGQAVQFF